MSKGYRLLLWSPVLPAIFSALVACHHAEQVQVRGEPLLSQSDQNFITEAQQLAARDRAFGTLIKGKPAGTEITQYADTVIRNDADALQKLAVMIEQYKFNAAPVPKGKQFTEESRMKSLSRKALERQFVNVILTEG